MSTERRNDIAQKIWPAISIVILTLFVHVAWNASTTGTLKAEAALEQGHINSKEIAIIKEWQRSLCDDVKEIKELLKLRIQ